MLFQKITAKAEIDEKLELIRACLTGAEECVQSICGFVESGNEQPRGLAWYATYWLITASFVQATCYIYNPSHALAAQWREHLKRAVDCLAKLGAAHSMAFRARDILKMLLGILHAICYMHAVLNITDQSESSALFGDSTALTPSNGQEAALDFWLSNMPRWASQPDPMLSMEGMGSFPWYAQGSADAELLDATGGIMLQVNSDSLGPYSEQRPWMSS